MTRKRSRRYPLLALEIALQTEISVNVGKPWSSCVTFRQIEELLHNRELIVYTHEALYSKTISQYDQNFSYTSHDPLMQPKFLGARGARKQDVDEEMREKVNLLHAMLPSQ